MKKFFQFSKLSLVVACLLSMVLLAACGTKDPDPTTPTEETTLKGSISANRTLDASKKYTLSGFVYVEAGATLTIPAGTIIFGDKATKGTLIVKPGAKIMAEGTASKPIVFTSAQPKGSRAAGDWGGVVILGKAPVNKSPITVEGENISTFGGTDDNDNSGVFKYVRIEFAGIAFEPDKELNSLTLGGVGKGTTIEYIQVSYGNDDSYEWFGGNVNAKYLIAFAGLDDDFDTDNGYSGFVQYGLSIRDPRIADQFSGSVSNGFESDNDAQGTTQTPQTSAKFANMSIFINADNAANSKYFAGCQIRRNSAMNLYNSVIVGNYPWGLELRDSLTLANHKNGGFTVAGLTTDKKYRFNVNNSLYRLSAADTTTLTATAKANQFEQLISSLGLNANYNSLTSPGFLLQSNSPLLTNGVTLPTGFEPTNYRGAFNATNNWTAGWTNFNPQNTDY